MLERMQTKVLIDKIILERKENCQIVITGEVREILVANRLHHPWLLCDTADWAEVCGIEELYGLKQVHLNDDRLSRALEDLKKYSDEIVTDLGIDDVIEFALKLKEILRDTTSIY